MAVFSNAKKGFSGKISFPSAFRTFRTFKSVSAEPELMLDIFGVEADMQELVTLPDGATGRGVQSRFDAEMIHAEAGAAIVFAGIEKLEACQAAKKNSFQFWTPHPKIANCSRELLVDAISRERAKFFHDLLELDTSKDLDLIGAFRGTESKLEALDIVVDPKADIYNVKNVEDNEVLQDPQPKETTSRLRRARRLLAFPFTSGIKAFKTALSCVSASR